MLVYQPKKLEKNRSLFQAEIIDLDYQGFGVAKVQGKTWFVENALPQEVVKVNPREEKRQYGIGTAQQILRESPLRQSPKCDYFTQCGGCQNQHIPVQLQRESKQKALFQRLTKLQGQGIEFMPMIVGDEWQYRRRARLSIKFNPKTKALQMGFRQKSTTEIVSISHCDVLEPALNALLAHIQQLLTQFSQPKQLGHLELTLADNGVAMLLRHSKNLAPNDCTLLQNFALQHSLSLFVQNDNEIEHWFGETPYYQLQTLKLAFDIRDFIQVNRQLNQRMVETALAWLALEKTDNVLDLFCGMGNFTLPISQQVQSVVGIEGVAEMVQKAQANAQRNHCHNVQFCQGDLTQPFIHQPWASQPFNKILLDPPRSGALFALNSLCQLQAEKILYVSCNPATLVRDAEILLQAGYQIIKVAMIDMFPHTGHLESITLFSRK